MPRRVVITGLGVVTALGDTLDQFWSGLLEWMRTQLATRGLIRPDDLDLMTVYRPDAPAAVPAAPLSAKAIALPRWAIASWNAERRRAWSPALPHHSIARSSRPASVK